MTHLARPWRSKGKGVHAGHSGASGAHQPVFLYSCMQTSQHPEREGDCWWQEVFPEKPTRA